MARDRLATGLVLGMKVRTQCLHGLYDKHQIDRPVGEGIVMEILCAGGPELLLEPVPENRIAVLQDKPRQFTVYVHYEDTL